jgi:DNA recombination protein RmuC
MTPTVLIIVLLALMAAGLVFLALSHAKSRREADQKLQDMARQIIDAQKQDQSMQFLQRELANLREQMGKSISESARLMTESQKTVGDRLDKAAEVVGNVQRALGALDSATKQVYLVGKDIAQLQEILRAPKLRGTLGELFLGDLLSQILPPNNFVLQHMFKTGETVDAVIKLGGRLVCVDAKFPLENFKRLIQSQDDPQEKTNLRRKFISDVKRHIDAIAAKYILQDEGTFDFALMYIPAENVYYETIIKDDASSPEDNSLMSYAFTRRVVPVSPNSFYAYLHTIALGLRGLEVEQNARVIIEQLARLRGDFSRFKDDFSLVGKHLSNTRTKYEDAERRMARFEDKLISTSDSSSDVPLVSSEIESLPLK